MKGGSIQYNKFKNTWIPTNKNIYSKVESYILNILNIRPVCVDQNERNITKFTGEIFKFPRIKHRCFNKSFAQAYNDLNNSNTKYDVYFLIKTAIDNRIYVYRNYTFDDKHQYFLNSLINTYNYLININQIRSQSQKRYTKRSTSRSRTRSTRKRSNSRNRRQQQNNFSKKRILN